MNRPELYNKTVDILYQAYFNDTLEHGNCYACAVGNMIAANRGYVFVIDKKAEGEPALHWKGFLPYRKDWTGPTAKSKTPQWIKVINTRINEKDCAEIDSTGYTLNEISKIENEFEDADFGSSLEDWMFNGLCAVLEALKQIHEVTDEDLLQANNKRFADHYKLKIAAV